MEIYKDIQIVIKDTKLEDFRRYAENDLIDKLSKQNILFSSQITRKIKKIYGKISGYLLKTGSTSPKEFKGGLITEKGDEIRYHIMTFKKPGAIGKFLSYLPLLDWPDPYSIEVNMIVNKCSDNNSTKIILSPGVIYGTSKKSKYNIFWVVLIVGTILLSFIMFSLIFLLLVLVPIMVLRYKLVQIINEGKFHLMNTIQDTIKSDFQIKM